MFIGISKQVTADYVIRSTDSLTFGELVASMTLFGVLFRIPPNYLQGNLCAMSQDSTLIIPRIAHVSKLCKWSEMMMVSGLPILALREVANGNH